MKNQLKVWLLICSNVALTACTFGNGTICGPLTPVAYCDKEVLQKLMHPKPYIEYWEKPGMTKEGRSQDSIECGGGGGERAPGFSPLEIKAAQRPGEKEQETYTRLHHEWQHCMLNKGYRFTREY